MPGVGQRQLPGQVGPVDPGAQVVGASAAHTQLAAAEEVGHVDNDKLVPDMDVDAVAGIQRGGSLWRQPAEQLISRCGRHADANANIAATALVPAEEAARRRLELGENQCLGQDRVGGGETILPRAVVASMVGLGSVVARDRRWAGGPRGASPPPQVLEGASSKAPNNRRRRVVLLVGTVGERRLHSFCRPTVSIDVGAIPEPDQPGVCRALAAVAVQALHRPLRFPRSGRCSFVSCSPAARPRGMPRPLVLFQRRPERPWGEVAVALDRAEQPGPRIGLVAVHDRELGGAPRLELQQRFGVKPKLASAGSPFRTIGSSITHHFAFS